MTPMIGKNDPGQNPLRVAVVGGGAAGISAAWKLIKNGAYVTLYETEAKLGGHCFSVDIPGTNFSVDGGVSDFNETTFLNFREMLNDLQLTYHPICQNASFAWPDGRVCWYVHDGVPHFIAGVADPELMIAEIGRFSRTCVEVLNDVRQTGRTAADYISEQGYSRDFERCWFVPRAGGCFPMPERHPKTFLIQSIVSFWKIHGLVGERVGARYVLDGGMAAWPRAFEQRFMEEGGDLRLGSRVVGITRRPERIRIASISADGSHHDDFFEQVIVATNANQVLGLFDDVSHAQSTAFAGLSWQRARVFVHRDKSLMPQMREAWGAYNYLLDDESGDALCRPTITFWPKALTRSAELPDEVFVSVNPPRIPKDIIASRFLVHPSADRQCEVTIERLKHIQGLDRTWYAGAYLLAPHVHEQAIQVGFKTAENLLSTINSEIAVDSSSDVVDFLSKTPEFADLDKGLFNDLVWAFVPFSAPAGTVIYQKDDSPNGVLLVKSGYVEITKEDGRFCAKVGPNDLVGEIAFLDRGPRTATVVALTDVRGWNIDYGRLADLRKDVQTHEAASVITYALARKVAKRLLNRLNNMEVHPRLEGPDVSELLRGVLKPFIDLQPTYVAEGSIILKRGMAANTCKWLLEGTASARDVSNRERFTIGSGGAVGLIEIFTRNPSTNDYIAAEPCCTLDVPLEIFNKLLQGQFACDSRVFDHYCQMLVQWYRETLLKEKMVAPPAIPEDLSAAELMLNELGEKLEEAKV